MANELPASAATYLFCQQWLLGHVRFPSAMNPNGDHNLNIGDGVLKSYNEWMSSVYGELRAARVFDVDRQTYGTLYHTTDVYTTEKLCGVKWVPEQEHADISDGESNDVRQKVVAAGCNLPLPEPLPFPQVFFAFGEGISLQPQQVFWHLVANDADNEEIAATGVSLGLFREDRAVLLHSEASDFSDATWKLLGFLVTSAGMVVGFFEATHHPSRKKVLSVQTYHFSQAASAEMVAAGSMGSVVGIRRRRSDSAVQKQMLEWHKVYSLTPWVVTSLVAVVNAHRTFIEQDMRLSYQMNYKQHAKKQFGLHKSVPPPFYMVELKDQLIRHASRKSLRASFKWHLAHRFDVRGHERIKVARGTLPLDSNIQHKLEKRKYKIFTLDEPDVETYRLLMQRGLVQKRPGEWLAIKRCWVKPFVKGPEDAPYVPSIRKVSMKGSR